MVRYLCVAEKPSISKAITQILSGGRFTTRNARHPQWIKNYDFSYRLPQHGPAFTDFTVTAVAGHLMTSDFPEAYKNWRGCDPFTLFDAPINQTVNSDPNQQGIAANLAAEARNATHLMIWTDCDREGEHIGSEVATVCRKANPRIIVKRARFSAIIANQINNACQNAVELDMRQVNAVAARMDLDLRVGAALTRTQTLGLQGPRTELAGPCQFPTLGFVVDQYERVQAFIAERFWFIRVAITREDSTMVFRWQRGKLFDHDVAEALFEQCQEEPEATVLSQQTKPTQKWKPLPLTTVELQKTGSRLLRMTPKQILDTSDSLYQRGILSYPRTETDIFDKDFDFMDLIQKQTGDGAWGPFATNLANGGFERPRNGKKDDKAHPPIHPTSHVNNLTGDDKKVYDLVVRRFLACCSKNARGLETTVELSIADERFTASGLIVQERNYLDVYIYDKWAGNLLPSFEVGERFVPDECSLDEGSTTRPNLLTEADLVSLMDKNGIGTDATIAEHIAKIIEREYVMKQRQGGTEYLVPSTLGIGLVEGYNAIGFDKSLSKPYLRRLTERRMDEICQGSKTKTQVIDETLDEYRQMFIKAKREFQTFIDSVAKYIDGDGGGGAGGDGPSDDDQGGGGAPAAGRRPRGGAAEGRGRGRGRGAAARGRGAGRGAGAGRNNEDDDDDGSNGPTGGGARGRGRGRSAAATATAATGPTRAEAGRSRKNAQPLPPAVPKDEVEIEDEAETGHDNYEYDMESVGMEQAIAIGRKLYIREREAMLRNTPPGMPPTCDCGDLSVKKTVMKQSANTGRKFWACHLGMGGCGFFAWADEPGASRGNTASPPKKRPFAGPSDSRSPVRPRFAAPTGQDAAEGQRCDCNLTPVERTVTKEGPNTGRRFLMCNNTSKSAQCKYFVWLDEGDASGRAGGSGSTNNGAGTGVGGGRPPTGECFICKQEGHWSRDCPSKNIAKGDDWNGSGNGGGVRAPTGECFICKEEGHWSRDCPSKNERGGGGGGASNGARAAGGGGTCFSCDEEGHYSSACPNPKGGSGTGGGSSKRGRGRGRGGSTARGGRGRGNRYG
ncbi:BZ3500_MvSof-1268-A1-R1_Chr2-1g04416 [Microbotryum saponariae]|uniref:DNA topoisomerase n=1 Tax=Microbotryum saponariae TaxID=289078 RepID=A0A2X0K8J4_9BASI|nr:BZ3500_MvSof-1268-A1-R1_Chr2-1g04416 [Microbotryum saponariae]SCZ91637.1 BZ3501_MvSof-1269-A2-R1_Chr2-1g04072 [Microbotryum saponariae]